MPSTSAKQHRFMEAAAHDPKLAKNAGISQAVSRDFVLADMGRKFAPPEKPSTKKGKRR